MLRLKINPFSRTLKHNLDRFCLAGFFDRTLLGNTYAEKSNVEEDKEGFTITKLSYDRVIRILK